MSWLLPLKRSASVLLPAGRIENVVLFDFDPGQLAPLGRDGITLASELFFAGQ